VKDLETQVGGIPGMLEEMQAEMAARLASVMQEERSPPKGGGNVHTTGQMAALSHETEAKLAALEGKLMDIRRADAGGSSC
jgi:hypothetical protein